MIGEMQMNETSLLESIKFEPYFDPSEAFESRRVSHFDHFLSSDEADSCKFLFYKLAMENNAKDDFIAIENKFLLLWMDFSGSGKNFGINGSIFEIPSLAELFSIGVGVVREKSGFPIFFSSVKVIWEPSYDLTHVLWIPKGADWSRVCQRARLFGLHILE